MINRLHLEDLEELDSTLEGVDEEERKERFKITNQSELTWAFRMLRSRKHQQAEYNKVCDEEVNRIREKQAKQNEQWDKSISFFNHLIEEYTRSMRENDPKFNAVTPYGTTKARKQQDEWIYDDEKLLENLRKSHPDLVRKKVVVEESVDKKELKKRFKDSIRNGVVVDPETGEIIQGVTVKPRPEKITIEVD